MENSRIPRQAIGLQWELRGYKRKQGWSTEGKTGWTLSDDI